MTLREQVERIDKLAGMWVLAATNDGTHGQPEELATWWREIAVVDGAIRTRGVRSDAGYERRFPGAARRAGELRAELDALIQRVGGLERARERLAHDDEVERMASARALCARLVASGRIPAGVPVRVEYAGNEARRVLVEGQEGRGWIEEVAVSASAPRVMDANTGDVLDGQPSPELVAASLAIPHTGAVGASQDADGVWQFVRPEDARPDTRTVWIQE